jgi:hypothetical protein
MTWINKQRKMSVSEPDTSNLDVCSGSDIGADSTGLSGRSAITVILKRAEGIGRI